MVQRTKLSMTIPNLVRDHYRRPRLDRLLDLFDDRAVIVLKAPFGFGKSQLLVHWRRLLISAGFATLWCDPRESANRAVERLFAEMSLVETDPMMTSSRSTRPLEDEANLSFKLAQLAFVNRRVALLVDDIDTVAPAMVAGWEQLASNLPANCQLICSCSAPPPFSVAKGMAYGVAALIEQSELSFTSQEAEAVLTEAHSREIVTNQMEDAIDLLEGWPIAVGLLAAALRQGFSLATFHARSIILPGLVNLFDNLIFPSLPDQLKRAALSLAVLDEPEAELARFATGVEDIDRQVSSLRVRTPFMRDQGNSMRLRKLARAHLLETDGLASCIDGTSIHNRAAEWLIAEGQPSRAVRHYLSIGKQDSASEILDRSLFETVTRGSVETALGWLRAMPHDHQISHSSKVATAWTAAISGDQAVIEQYLSSETGILSKLEGLEPQQKAIVKGLLDAHADDPDAVRAGMAEDLDWSAMSLPFQAARQNMIRMVAQQSGELDPEQGDPLALWRDPQMRLQNFHGYSFSLFREAIGRLRVGWSRGAADLLKPALHHAETTSGRNDSLALHLTAAFAAACRQHGNDDAARSALAGRLDAILETGMPEALWMAFSTAAHLAMDEGNSMQAIELLDEVEERSAKRQLPRVVALAQLDRIRIAIRAGRSVQADVRHLQAALRRHSDEGSIRSANVRLAALMGLAHAATQERDKEQGSLYIGQGETLAIKLGRNRDLIELRILGAALHDKLGSESLATLRSDIPVEDGDWATLVRDCVASSGEPDRFRNPSKEKQKSIIDYALTKREHDIVELLARNLPNRAIAQALCLREETIKWHLRNLYAKLEAHDRRSAVAKAKLIL